MELYAILRRGGWRTEAGLHKAPARARSTSRPAGRSPSASATGVDNFLDFGAQQPGETVRDLGSGSGMASFLAANQVGNAGRAVGVDMTAGVTAVSLKAGKS